MNPNTHPQNYDAIYAPTVRQAGDMLFQDGAWKRTCGAGLAIMLSQPYYRLKPTTMKTLQKQLPSRVSFASPELALAVVAYLVSEHGYKAESNVGPHKINCVGFTNGEPVILSFFPDKKAISWWGNSRASGYTSIRSLAEFRTLITETPIKVGEYTAEVKPDGVQVGCTFVPWSTIEELLKRKP